jgi:hypothetical protein
MSMRDQVIEHALKLSPEDCAFVADRLERSLTEEAISSPEIARAWTAEIERRIAAYDRGEMEGSDADSALARMRAYLAEHRARKAAS